MTVEAGCLTAPGNPATDGVQLCGTGGITTVLRYLAERSWAYELSSAHSQSVAVGGDGSRPTAEPMLGNWVKCIRTRERTIANEEVAWYSTVACYMALEAYRTKSRVVWNTKWDLPTQIES